jgi:hypothetical protein
MKGTKSLDIDRASAMRLYDITITNDDTRTT